MTTLVLLSSYNGEKYIRQQILSILNQKGIDIKLLVRDDGSTDQTLSILSEMRNEFPDKIDIIKGNNVGCRDSFHYLIAHASENCKGFNYYAFADQDDFWIEDKVSTGINALEKSSAPIRLYYCLPQYVDEDLNPIGTNISRSRATLAESFLLAPALGCTMIFSEDVLTASNKVCKAGNKSLHDIIAYRTTLSLGGCVIEDPIPHILYRQHSSNVVGGMQSSKTRWSRWLRWLRSDERPKSTMALDLLKVFSDDLPEKEKAILSLMASYPHSFSAKFKIIFSKDFKSNKTSRNILFGASILFNSI